MIQVNQIPSLLITQPNHPALFEPTRPVVSEADWNEVSRHAPAMLGWLLRRESGGVAMAANQIALPLSFFVVAIPGDTPHIFVNPTVSGLGREIDMPEGCLSNPGEVTKRKRHVHVNVSAFTIRGDSIRVTTTEGWYRHHYEKFGKLFAQACQHEAEHLDGIDTRTGDLYNPDLW